MAEDLEAEIFYLYTLSSPENEDIVKYVGYTISPKRRLNKHIHSYKYGNNKIKCWIKSLHDKGLKPIMKIIDETTTLEKAHELEIAYIKLFKSFGANLKNATLGGAGTWGWVYNRPRKQKIIKEKVVKEAKDKKVKVVKEVKNDAYLFMENIISSFLQGESVINISKRLNVYVEKVRDILKETNNYYSEHRPMYKKDFITFNVLKEMYIDKNMTKREMSEELGITERNLKKRLKDFNLYKSEQSKKELQDRIRNENKTIKDDMIKPMADDVRAGLTFTQLSEKYGISATKLRNSYYKYKHLWTN